ncbi:hypothetical protein L1887_08403 [Cichorium endivia]|nr:hypothetical protein L1887_08403 [Cichorium endivia]
MLVSSFVILGHRGTDDRYALVLTSLPTSQANGPTLVVGWQDMRDRMAALARPWDALVVAGLLGNRIAVLGAYFGTHYHFLKKEHMILDDDKSSLYRWSLLMIAGY